MSGADSLQLLRLHYARQPFEVSIETLALCNAACTFCPYPTLERRGAKMSDRLIYELLHQMIDWSAPFFISPFKVNEPLLDPRLPAICWWIEKEIRQARLRLFTNGQPLTPQALGWIGELTSLDGLWVSLNSCDPQEYEEMMKLDFAKTEKRLDALHEACREGRFPHRVTVSRVMTGDRALDLNFQTAVQEYWPLFTPFLIKRDGWLGYVAPSDPRVPQMPCGRWFELNITAEGKVVLCCMDGKGEYVLGDVNHDPLLSIYNQPHLLERRRALPSRQGIEPCQRCTY